MNFESHFIPADNIWSRFAESYDEVIPRLDCYQRMLAKILRDSQAAKLVIDAGCGTGLVSQKLVARSQRVAGFDNNLAMLSRAFDRRQNLQAENHWHILLGDVSTFPAGLERPAQAVIMNNVLFFVSEPRQALQEAAAHLEEGGVFIATGPRRRPSSEEVLSRAIVEWQEGGRFDRKLQEAVAHHRQLAAQLSRNEMVSFFEPEELVEELRACGFGGAVLEASGEDYYGANFYVAVRK